LSSEFFATLVLAYRDLYFRHFVLKFYHGKKLFWLCKISNANLAFSDLGGTLSYNSLTDKPTLFDGSYNSLTNKLVGGTNIQILNGAINNLYSYTLPIAGVGTGGALGGVKVDNSTITINNGVISATAGTSYTLPIASTSVIGGVRPDGTSILINEPTGIITAVQIQSDWNITDNLSRAYILNKPTILNSKWSQSGTQIWYNGGNVGIGTNNPNATLHLHKTGTTQDVRLQITDGTTTGNTNRGLHLIKSGIAGYLYNYEDGPLLLGTNGTDRMRILANGDITINSGNVGIGTTNPQRKLYIQGAMRIGGIGACLDFGDDFNTQLYKNGSTNELAVATNFVERFKITGDGLRLQNLA